MRDTEQSTINSSWKLNIPEDCANELEMEPGTGDCADDELGLVATVVNMTLLEVEGAAADVETGGTELLVAPEVTAEAWVETLVVMTVVELDVVPA